MANKGIKFKGRGGKRKVSVSEALLRKEWAELKKRAATDSEPPNVSLEAESFDDLYAWGDWVAKKGNITPTKSRQLLQEVREYMRSK